MNEQNQGGDKSHKMSSQEILEIWQHFANLGGHDKDRMVTILTFLTPVLTAMISFAVLSDSANYLRKVAAISGFITAVIAGLIVLMYAGYSNRNWETADEIAERYCLVDDDHREFLKPLKPEQSTCNPLGRWPVRIGNCLSKPHNPKNSFAPIFTLFLIISIVLSITSLIITITI